MCCEARTIRLRYHAAWCCPGLVLILLKRSQPAPAAQPQHFYARKDFSPFNPICKVCPSACRIRRSPCFFCGVTGGGSRHWGPPPVSGRKVEIGLHRTGAFLRPIIGWGSRAGGYWCQPAALASQQARGDCVSSIMVQVHSCRPQGSGTILLRQRQASLVARPVAVSLPRTLRYGRLPELVHTCLFHSELPVPVHNSCIML